MCFWYQAVHAFSQKVDDIILYFKTFQAWVDVCYWRLQPSQNQVRTWGSPTNNVFLIVHGSELINWSSRTNNWLWPCYLVWKHHFVKWTDLYSGFYFLYWFVQLYVQRLSCHLYEPEIHRRATRSVSLGPRDGGATTTDLNTSDPSEQSTFHNQISSATNTETILLPI